MKESEMLTQTDKLLATYSQRGKEGKKIDRMYRQLFKKELYECAYAGIASNRGSITQGTGPETLDGFSQERIEGIIQKMKQEQYRWRPARRVYIPKENGKNRPLGIPSGDDKVVQAAMKLLLEAYYEPTFSNRSHGFRPARGCHTALQQVTRNHSGIAWFIEGDIKGCFDNIDHNTLIGILEEKIEDGRIISLVRKLLKAGYMENWQRYTTYSGTPQGGIVSPLLANIYLDKLDKWVEEELMPKYNRSRTPRGRRRENPEYQSLTQKRRYARKRGDIKTFKELGRQRDKIPSLDTHDEGYRKLEYVRYADDFLLSFAGPKSEAEEIKREIGEFLKDTLKLEMSKEKTLITHARTKRAKFLGYEVEIIAVKGKNRKMLNGNVELRVPEEVVTKAIRRYTRKGKSHHRKELTVLSTYEIIMTYQTEYKGLVEFYKMAHNIAALGKVTWRAQQSLLKTLAHKHKTSSAKMRKRLVDHEVVDGKKYKVLKCVVERDNAKPLVTYFGAVPLVKNPTPTELVDEIQALWQGKRGRQLIKRLNSNVCEMCNEPTNSIEIHHVRKIKDLNKPGRKPKPEWVIKQAEMNRNTLAVCYDCHQDITHGRHNRKWEN